MCDKKHSFINFGCFNFSKVDNLINYFATSGKTSIGLCFFFLFCSQDQRYILYRDLKLLLNIDICPRYDCRSGRQVNRGKKSIFLSAAESVLKVCILAKIYC